MNDRIRECPETLAWQKRILRLSIPVEDGCWEWQGVVDKGGYGKFSATFNGKRRWTGAHRAAWLAFKGPLLGDLVIDHLCRNRRCVNPDHLEPVTNAVNCQRGDHSMKTPPTSEPKDPSTLSCGSHGRSDGYVKMRSNKRYRWICRQCRRDSDNKRRRRN